MWLICKTAFCCDSAQRVAAHHHQVLSPSDSHLPDVLTRSTAKSRPEFATEMALAEMRHPGEVSQIDPLRGRPCPSGPLKGGVKRADGETVLFLGFSAVTVVSRCIGE
jgi:hypothetical protein